MSRLLERGGVRLETGPQGLAVSGDVDFEIAAPLAEAGRAWLADQAAGARVVLDLGGVEQVSSAALSVLLEWARQARAAGVEIDQVKLSAPLARLTRVAGLDALLPLAGEA
ncbi:STAS domain-containing protein [Halomonas sp. MCCC 1A17488]|uniref:STAS domain-containing protein n=1 Tax=unclassified Halomonas TaxID=2609666 RepID=UPI0018D25E6C|nr:MULTISPECIES: STAS domain-containing protein [unclassified Halomonas]MCE8014620.1 STAS domain-containing protein [Halomonas sp. MCCC 1A17488]MCG3237953.1 STAS domain-containing protein [Halomonas sp. MCCC 1A17488]QPP48264.1 STAS domain-containing protein [Halomonas sp. SS10-MC5]